MNKQSPSKLIGPFKQMVTMNGLPLKGALKDEQLEIITDGGILVQDGTIQAIGDFQSLKQKHQDTVIIEAIDGDLVALPGFVDAHTHICFGGSRAKDYAARNNGKSYLEIAQDGGGIWDTVTQTRAQSEATLAALTLQRLDVLLHNGITTVEVKSGYGLSIEQELKMLRAIQAAGQQHVSDVISTCLAAHIIPKDIANEAQYLALILNELVPAIQKEKLTKRFDVFIEQGAFSVEQSKSYLQKLKNQGFQLTVHADQFTPGGSQVAIDCGALSADHLEASGAAEIMALAQSEVIPVALPGASIGLGCAFTPARKLLDAGASLAIASDWNPGSAPQGNLLIQAAILGTFEKLSAAEVLSGITFRAAQALGLSDRGCLNSGKIADIIAFPCNDYREILYHQGELKVSKVWKNGVQKA